MKLLCLLVLIEAFLTATACSSTKTAVPGKKCVINSDCTSPLSCSWGICHEACRGDSDCAGGALCVWDKTDQGNDQGVRVCLLHECDYNSGCDSPLVCGGDFHCRNECEADIDCANKNDICVVGGLNGEKVCAEPTRVGGNGEFIFEPDAGMSASDASAGVDSGADAGTGADASVTADAGGEAPVVTGVQVEQEPNDDETTANPYTPGTQVNASIGSATDIDTYKFIAPADPAGGFYQGSFTNMGLGAIQFSIVSPTNNAALAAQPAGGAAGAFRYFYWAAAPGQTYYLVVNPTAATVFNYTVKVDYTAVIDEHEPNDVKARATVIGLGTPVTASFFTGYKMSTIDPLGYSDWYVADLQAGPTTVAVHMVPDDLRLQVRVLNATTDVVIGSRTNLNAGADIDAPFMIPTAGSYNVVVEQYGAAVPLASRVTTMDVPPSFTEQYQLTVTQP
jgi:hypothetical protein